MAITNGASVGFVNAGTRAKLDQYKSENALDAGTFYIADDSMYLGTANNTFIKLSDVLVVTSLPSVSLAYVGKLVVNVTTGTLHVTEAGGAWKEVSSAPEAADSPLIVVADLTALNAISVPGTNFVYYVVEEKMIYTYSGSAFAPLVDTSASLPTTVWEVWS
jgi:hypothetical protein